MPLDSNTIVEKRAGEKLLVAMDFGSWLTEGETIVTITDITISGESGTVNYSGATISGSRVVFFIDNGEAGVRYAATVKITTSLGQIFIGEGPLKVVP